MDKRTYTFDAELGIWRTPAHDSLGYSDGEEVERRLLAALKQCHDVSSRSDELCEHIVDWPSEYHFSSARHNLLRAFKIDPKHRILELGCGCGAITRYLGETGATVVAIEGSRLRAQIAAERCRDLPNVSVVCDNLASFESPDKFDFVTLIGVLEYSPQFIVGDDPVGACLGKAKSHLSNDGNLLVAIENRLGLKYFSGCNEDHVGREFVGIEDLYDANTAITLGRRELLCALEKAGFATAQCMFAFPDYKLPEVIISEVGAADARFRNEALLLRSHSPDRVTVGPRSFSEPLAWASICRNGLLPDLSNAFLVIAGESPASLQSKLRRFLAVSFSGSRVKKYSVETLFHYCNGEIVVTKQLLHANLPEESTSPHVRLHLRCTSAPYLRGQMYMEGLMRQWRRGIELKQIVQWARPWTEMLLAVAHYSAVVKSRLVPGEYFDCTPFNLLQTDDGQLHFIDREWLIDDMIPMNWVFIRGLAYTLASCVSSPSCNYTARSIITDVGGRLGIPITDNDLDDAFAREHVIQTEITGPAATHRHMERIVKSVPRAVVPVFDACRHSEEMNSQLRAELRSMTESWSWKFTQPLRFVHRLLSSPLSRNVRDTGASEKIFPNRKP